MITPNPTLIIGLGGTGQLVACQVLKDVMELYDLHDNNLPPKVQILAIDTDFANVAKVDMISRSGTVGSIQLPNNMRVPIGDFVRDYAMQIKLGKHPEIASWFDADWFLAQQGNDALLNLSHGAGQYRPLGRIAVPYNMNVQGAFLKNRIESAITNIRNQCDGGLKELNVCITGSLCGGTGAGLCVDVAYLVKQLVGAGTTINLVGYLVLPQAFDKTVPSNDDNKRAFQRRAFAAMRELRRFAREVKYESGLPMYYAGEEYKEDNILRGKLRETLFNLLYYFDGSLTRTVQDARGTTQNIPVEVKDGVVPLIAEAILMWVDGATANEISSHIANLNAQYRNLIPATLPENAAIAGGFGAYTLQLPIYHIVEGWTYELARRALRDFLGIVPVNPNDPIDRVAPGENTTNKTAVNLREDWRGGERSITGATAARDDWQSGTVANIVLSDLVKDHLTTGKAEQLGGVNRDNRVQRLNTRSLQEWEVLLNNGTAFSEEDDFLRTQFLHPASVTVEKGNLLGSGKKVRNAVVGESKGDSRKKPVQAAKDLQANLEQYLSEHLGAVNPIDGCRGGSDSMPDGEYTHMLQRMSLLHIENFTRVLSGWVDNVLNQDINRPHAGKVGYLISLLTELHTMCNKTTARLADVEKVKLGDASSNRNSADVVKAYTSMEKNVNKQSDYLRIQQEYLKKERVYLSVRTARRVAQSMSTLVKYTLMSLTEWKKALADELYATLWSGYEEIRNQRNGLKHQEAVRKMIEDRQIEANSYALYTANNTRIDEILSDLKWQVVPGNTYVESEAKEYSTLLLRLSLANTELPVGNPGLISRTFLQRCRNIFQQAWENETALGWLVKIYDDSQPDKMVDDLAQFLTLHGAPLLRTAKQAPYKIGYIRAMYSKGSDEEGWVQNLMNRIVDQVRTDPQQSKKIESTDPYRVTFLGFHELNNVENLLAYQEGRDGLNKSGGYMSLPAQTSPAGGLSRQILHIFPAEHRACVYEERLGELLPDKVVSLLEDESRLRQLILTWAYGNASPDSSADILLNEYQFPEDHKYHARKWVWRLSTGPFDDDINPITREKNPALHYWLTQPNNAHSSLVEAVHGFLLDGADRHQNPDRVVTIDYTRVWKELNRQRSLLASRFNKEYQPANGDGEFNRMLAKMSSITKEGEKNKAVAYLSDYQHLQGLNKRLFGNELQVTHEIDATFYKLAQLFIADELLTIFNDMMKLNH